MNTTLMVLGGSAVALSFGFWIAERKARRAHEAWCATAARADGVVSRLGLRGHYSRNPPTDEDRNWYIPVVRFRAADGAEYEFDAEGTRAKVGARVRVAYEPALPSNARALERPGRMGCAAILLAAGLALLITGLVR